jgi:hypothetical protein
VPYSWRARVILIGDEIFTKVGGYALVGGALMGIIGVLVAIPAAAALRLLLREVTFRRLDTT